MSLTNDDSIDQTGIPKHTRQVLLVGANFMIGAKNDEIVELVPFNCHIWKLSHPTVDIKL